MEDIKKLIERRWKFIQLLYRFFCLEIDKKLLIKDINDNSQVKLDNDEKSILINAVEKLDEIISFIKSNLSSNWSWERLPNIQKSILVNGYIEICFEHKSKAIVINESLKLSRSYLPSYETSYINAILDKINE